MTPSKPKPIPNPRRLLILTPTSHSTTTIPPFLLSLTGSPVLDPQSESPSFAGYTTHPPLVLENKYYKASVPIWVDEIPLPIPSSPHSSSSPLETLAEEKKPGEENGKEDKEIETETLTPETWKSEFSGSEARVVRDAVGGVIICIRNEGLDPGVGSDTGTEDLPEWRGLRAFLEAVGGVKGVMDEERGGLGDVLGLVVLVGRESAGSADDDGGEKTFSVPWWEDRLFDLGLVGFEVVSWDPRENKKEVRDHFGEYQGMRRIREILETHEWDSSSGDLADGGDLEADELERHLLEDGFNLEVNELEREMVGLRFAMENGEDMGDLGGDDEMRVESMEALMLRMKAIKDMSDELPENERKRFAAKAVRDIMKEL
ncbi:alpha and gamma adaptin binding protein p34-domain-containing protein [Aspergillus alliaceus]|uniref:Alpha and gamma adaptin binding protein p34-domain-containing protein n=1 Tax=Petromyces alliaceus TaxID=209559 RepID=A0A5N7CCX3_PETAA|nr:alpha and gamma adaptin binding protein p34-domain-containing protein [Aspergillus alliaceus]